MPITVFERDGRAASPATQASSVKRASDDFEDIRERISRCLYNAVIGHKSIVKIMTEKLGVLLLSYKHAREVIRPLFGGPNSDSDSDSLKASGNRPSSFGSWSMGLSVTLSLVTIVQAFELLDFETYLSEKVLLALPVRVYS